MKKNFPGPGYYEPIFNEQRSLKKTATKSHERSLERLTRSVQSSRSVLEPPGPASYQIDEASKKVSINGGTGAHNGYAISFTKGERNINQQVKLKAYIPGPGYYYNGDLAQKPKTSN